jgi:hypothetical protein
MKLVRESHATNATAKQADFTSSQFGKASCKRDLTKTILLKAEFTFLLFCT